MATRGQDIVSLIKRQIEEFGGDLTLVDVGTVVQVGDGIASIQGLQGVRSNELLDFGNDILGLASTSKPIWSVPPSWETRTR